MTMSSDGEIRDGIKGVRESCMPEPNDSDSLRIIAQRLLKLSPFAK